MEEHAKDFRRESGDAEAAEHLKHDYRKALLASADRALCDFAMKLTREPSAMRPEDLEALRGHGLDDAAISDAVQVIGYFNYINRVADALGVDPEPSS